MKHRKIYKLRFLGLLIGLTLTTAPVFAASVVHPFDDHQLDNLNVKLMDDHQLGLAAGKGESSPVLAPITPKVILWDESSSSQRNGTVQAAGAGNIQATTVMLNGGH
jgi:hypothetical protein